MPLNEICEQITSKRLALHITARSLGTSNRKPPMGTSHKVLVPMRAPYRTRLLKCPPVVGAGLEPQYSDRELYLLSTRLT